MKTRNIVTTSLQGAIELYNYPFVHQRKNVLEIDVIQNNEIEKFGEITGIAHADLLYYKEELGFFLYQTVKETNEKNNITECYCWILDRYGRKQKLVMPVSCLDLGDVHVLTYKYLLFKDKILRLSDLHVVMEIPISKETGLRRMSCKFVQHLEEDKFIICYVGVGTTVVVVDLASQVITRRRDDREYWSKNFRELKGGRLIFYRQKDNLTCRDGKQITKREEEICVLDRDLKEIAMVPLREGKRKITSFEMSLDGMNFFADTTDGEIFRYNFQSKEWTSLSIPKYRTTWDFVGISKQWLCFQVASKKIAIYEWEKGKTQLFSFKDPITNCFMKDDVFYIATGVDIERDVFSWEIIKEGVMDIYCVELD